MRHRFVLLAAVTLTLCAHTSALAQAIDEDSTLSWRLQELATESLRSASAAQQADAISLVARGPNSLSRLDGSPVVEIRAAGDPRDVARALRNAGAEVIHVSEELGIVTAAVPEQRLRAVGDVEGVEWVEEVIVPQASGLSRSGASGAATNAINTCATGLVSEGDVQLRANVARGQFDIDGAGVEVGVMSNSYDIGSAAKTRAAADIATGDLPGAGNPCGRTTPVELVREGPCAPADCTDEGRAMLQIVHDLAPGAALSFASASGGQSIMADNVRALAATGSDVIVDDITYATSPFYQDGPVGQAINEVTAQGIPFFTAAANDWGGSGLNSFEATAGYRSTACPPVVLADRAGGANSCMDFGGGDNTFDATFRSQVGLALGWAQPQLGVTDDFDIYVLDSVDDIVAVDKSNSLTAQTANEFAGANLTADTPLRVVIRRYASSGAPGTPRIKVISTSGSMIATQAVAAPDVQGPTIFGHHGAESAISVAAAPYNNSAVIEGFSSRGPVTTVFGPVTGTASPAAALPAPRTINKPDLTASNRGITTFFGSSANRFSGTSAAAPHAAAVTALQLSARPDLTPAQVKQALAATARPVGSFGILAAGAGLVDAVAAVGANPTGGPGVAITARPPAATASAQPTFEFTLTGRGPRATCIVDGAEQACSSPFTLASPLADGPHTVTIRATDGYGQTGEAAASFTVDATAPPKPAFKKGPKKTTKSNKAKFVFTGEPGATFACSLDRKAFRPCTSPAKVKVKKAKPKPKKHTFRVRPTDALGNVGAAATYRWKVVKKKRRT